MKKYFLELNLHLQRHLMYRARVLIWFFMDSFQVVILPFLWLSIYGEREVIAGFTRADIVTYYVVILVVGLLARSHLRRLVQVDIMRGDLSTILLKPIHYLLLRPIRELSYKIILLVLVLPFVGLVFMLLPNYIVLPKSAFTWLMFVITICLGYAISLLMEMTIGLLAAWIGETKSVDAIKNISFYILSGELAPLAFLPAGIATLAHYSPFRFILSTPVEIFLGHKHGMAIARDIGVALLWLGVFLTVLIILWRRVLKRYEGVGI